MLLGLQMCCICLLPVYWVVSMNSGFSDVERTCPWRSFVFSLLSSETQFCPQSETAALRDEES